MSSAKDWRKDDIATREPSTETLGNVVVVASAVAVVTLGEIAVTATSVESPIDFSLIGIVLVVFVVVSVIVVNVSEKVGFCTGLAMEVKTPDAVELG